MIRLLTLSLALGLVGCTPSIKHTSADLNPKTKPVKIKDVTEIFGNYSMIGRNPTDSDMGDYSGKVVIKKGLSDSSVVVEQSIGLSEKCIGAGQLNPKDGQLYVRFFTHMVEGTWTLLEDGTLKGTFNLNGRLGSQYDGIEVWSPISL